MAKCIIFPVILYLFLSGYADESTNIENSLDIQKTNKSKNWDFLMFTQTWPSTACIHWRALSDDNECYINRYVEGWQVHGIWPSVLRGQGPSFCTDERFDIAHVQKIREDLNRYWANIYASKPEHYLWAHEWEKYGTCVVLLPSLETQLQYFQQGLRWIKQYNMNSILRISGIEPSFEFAVFASDIENAVKRVLNVKPLIACEHLKENRSYYIYEVKLCFDKDLDLRNCPESYASSNVRCPTNGLVWYHPIQRNKNHNDYIDDTIGKQNENNFTGE